VIGLPFSQRTVDWLARPVTRLNYSLVFTAPAEAFWVQMKVGLIVGLFIAAPAILWQVWAFIAPGLHTHEKKYAAPFVIIGSLLFLGGGAFSLFVVTPYAIQFLLSYARPGLTPMINAADHVDFLLKFTLAFGAVFELPLALTLLSARRHRESKDAGEEPQIRDPRRVSSPGAVLNAHPRRLQPGDDAGPLIVLYEVGIVCARIFGRSPRPRRPRRRSNRPRWTSPLSISRARHAGDPRGGLRDRDADSRRRPCRSRCAARTWPASRKRGTGKTAAFLIAAFTKMLRTPVPAPPPGTGAPRMLVIAPTRELVVQIDSDARLLGRFTPFRTLAVYGGIDYAKQREALAEGCDLLVGTPGRLIDYLKQRVWTPRRVEELSSRGDRMFDHGLHRRPPGSSSPACRRMKRQSYLFLRDALVRVLELTWEFMNNPAQITIMRSRRRPSASSSRSSTSAGTRSSRCCWVSAP